MATKRKNGGFSVNMTHVESVDMLGNFRSVYAVMATHEKATTLSQWYSEAKEICVLLSEHYKIDYRLVAAVMAVTSPQGNVTRNINLTTRFCASYRAGKLRTDDFAYIPAFTEKAIKILETGNVFPYLKGDKVISFYNNIIGNEDSVTLDVHMLNIAINGTECTLESNRYDYSVTGKAYAEIAGILRQVATEVNLYPCEFQALLWVYCARKNQYFSGK